MAGNIIDLVSKAYDVVLKIFSTTHKSEIIANITTLGLSYFS